MGKAPKLADLDITKHESSRAQGLAEIAADTFADIVEELIPEGRITCDQARFVKSLSDS